MTELEVVTGRRIQCFVLEYVGYSYLPVLLPCEGWSDWGRTISPERASTERRPALNATKLSCNMGLKIR